MSARVLGIRYPSPENIPFRLMDARFPLGLDMHTACAEKKLGVNIGLVTNLFLV